MADAPRSLAKISDTPARYSSSNAVDKYLVRLANFNGTSHTFPCQFPDSVSVACRFPHFVSVGTVLVWTLKSAPDQRG